MEMTALEYLKEKARMTDNCNISCLNCSMYTYFLNRYGYFHSCLDMKDPEAAISIVQKWSEEHPRKTFLQDFLEKHPKALLNENGTPQTCPYRLGYVDAGYCDYKHYCQDCWNRPMEENDAGQVFI